MLAMSEHITKRHNKTLLLYHLVCPAKYRRDIKKTSRGKEENLGREVLDERILYEYRWPLWQRKGNQRIHRKTGWPSPANLSRAT